MRPVIVLVVALLAFVAPPVVGAADADVLQPGDAMSSSVGGCTLSFVFDGDGAHAGKVFISTAAHCVERVGDTVSATGNSGFARVAFISTNGADGLDWALLEVKPAFTDKVSPVVKGRTAPTGHTLFGEARTGDLLLFSGYGDGFHLTAQTRESRVGVLTSQGRTEYIAEAPIIFGDSGGPVLHESGKALGIVSRIEPGRGGDVGPTIQGMLAELAGRGVTVHLRTG